MLIQIIAATNLAPSVAEIAKIFGSVAEIAKIFGSVATKQSLTIESLGDFRYGFVNRKSWRLPLRVLTTERHGCVKRTCS